MFEEMSDVLHLVPNFDSERAFKVRTGDKKDLVVEINRRRKDLQGLITITRPLCRRRSTREIKKWVEFMENNKEVQLWKLTRTTPSTPITDVLQSGRG